MVNVRSHYLSSSKHSKGPSCSGQGPGTLLLKSGYCFFCEGRYYLTLHLHLTEPKSQGSPPSSQWNDFQVLLIEGFKISESYREERRKNINAMVLRRLHNNFKAFSIKFKNTDSVLWVCFQKLLWIKNSREYVQLFTAPLYLLKVIPPLTWYPGR